MTIKWEINDNYKREINIFKIYLRHKNTGHPVLCTVVYCVFSIPLANNLENWYLLEACIHGDNQYISKYQLHGRSMTNCFRGMWIICILFLLRYIWYTDTYFEMTLDILFWVASDQIMNGWNIHLKFIVNTLFIFIIQHTLSYEFSSKS